MTTDHTNDETPEAPPAREPEIGECEWPADPPPGCEVFGGGRTWYARVHGFLLAASARSQRDAVVDAWNCVTNFGDNPLPRIDPPYAKPTEPPPLPNGWRREDLIQGAVRGACKDDIEVWYDRVSDDVQVDENGAGHRVPAAVLRHLLGLTAPAADVRALERPKLYQGSCWCSDCEGALEETPCERCGAEEYTGPARLVTRSYWVMGLTGKGAP